jgi:hypothetical protein
MRDRIETLIPQTIWKEATPSRGTIFTYRLTSPSSVHAHSQHIRDAFVATKRVDRGSQFSISSFTGCVRFRSPDLWSTGGQGLLKDSKTARTAAKAFLQEAQSQLQSISQDVATLLPHKLEPLTASLVYGYDEVAPDHWLVRFQPYLPTGGGNTETFGAASPTEGSSISNSLATPTASLIPPVTTAENLLLAQPSTNASPAVDRDFVSEAPVVGGVVDVRLVSASKILALSSSWRPYSECKAVTRLAPPDEEQSAGGTTAAQPSICYLMHAENEPQEYISPFYRSDFGEIAPASDHSLFIEVIQEQSADGSVTLTAQPTGSSSHTIRYVWAAWRVGSMAEEDMQVYGTSPSLRLQAGAYNVILDAEDENKAFVRNQMLVYASPQL